MKFSEIYIVIAILFVGLISGKAAAQSSDPLRVEIDVGTTETDAYKVIPCNDGGLLLFYQSSVKTDTSRFWVFIFYGKDLKIAWEGQTGLYEEQVYRGYDLDNNHINLFFYNDGRKKDFPHNFQMIRIQLSSGNFSKFSISLPEKSSLVEADATGSRAFLAINLKEGVAACYLFDLDDLALTELNTGSHEESRAVELEYDSVNSKALLVLNTFNNKKEHHLEFFQYDRAGNLVGNSVIEVKEKDKKLNSAKVKLLGKDEYLFVGTYAVVDDRKMKAKEYFDDQASGYYVTKYLNGKQKLIEYHNFLEFENFTAYMQGAAVERIKKKAKRKDKDKDDFSLDYDLLEHEIMEYDSNFYFLTEAFYPEFRTVTTYHYDYYGRPVPYTYTVFEGYRYFNGFLACFDSTGNKIWDNGMEIYNILTPYLKKKISLHFVQDEVVMVYSSEGKLTSKIISGSETVEGIDTYPFGLMYPNDELVSASNSNFSHWYNNYFIAYGYQTIRNNFRLNENKRTVFYINKLAFE